MSTTEVPDPSATLMVFLAVGLLAFAMVNFGVPLIAVLNGLVAIMTFALIHMVVRAVRRAN